MTTIRAEFNLTGFEPSAIIDRVPVIISNYADHIGPQFKAAIEASVYDWPRSTRRSDGSVVTSPRNIVDTGNFRRSQTRRRESATSIRFTWGGSYGVTYAGYILQGIPERNYPPRDWITPVLNRNPLARYFRQEWSRLGTLSSQSRP